MRPASDTARRDVSPLLGEAEGGEIGGVVAQSADTRRCGVSPRRHGGAGSSASLGCVSFRVGCWTHLTFLQGRCGDCGAGRSPRPAE